MSRPFTGLIRGRARPRPRGGVLAAAAALLGLAACTAAGQPTLAPRATVAFESIDGLPEGLFRKLVHNLSEEAEARQLPVVTREGPAHYRVRGYAAAHVRGRRTSIAWVWDVYDAQERRALRIAGEEGAHNRGRGWAAADDKVLRRVAGAAMDGLDAFLTAAATEPSGGVPTPSEASLTLASHAGAPSQATGVFGPVGAVQPKSAMVEPGASEAPVIGEPVPVPRRRPPDAGFTRQAALGRQAR